MSFSVSKCLICGKSAFYSDIMYGFGLCKDHSTDFDFFMKLIKEKLEKDKLYGSLYDGQLSWLKRAYLEKSKTKNPEKRCTVPDCEDSLRSVNSAFCENHGEGYDSFLTEKKSTVPLIEEYKKHLKEKSNEYHKCTFCGLDSTYTDHKKGISLCRTHYPDMANIYKIIDNHAYLKEGTPRPFNDNQKNWLRHAYEEKTKPVVKTSEGKPDPIKETSFKAEDKVYNVPVKYEAGPITYQINLPQSFTEKLFQEELVEAYKKQINDQINNIVYGASMPKTETKDKCVVEGCDCFEKLGYIVCEEHNTEYKQLREKNPKADLTELLKQMAENLKLKNQQKQATKKKGEGVIMASDLYSERVLKEDSQDAAYRLAARQLTKTVKAPLVAAIARNIDPNDPGLSDKLVAFFSTELGEAFLKGFLSVGVGFVPAKIGDEKVKNLSRELRVSAGAEVGDFLADLLMTPLRSVISDFVSTVGTETHKALEQQNVNLIKVEIPVEMPQTVNK